MRGLVVDDGLRKQLVLLRERGLLFPYAIAKRQRRSIADDSDGLDVAALDVLDRLTQRDVRDGGRLGSVRVEHREAHHDQKERERAIHEDAIRSLPTDARTGRHRNFAGCAKAAAPARRAADLPIAGPLDPRIRALSRAHGVAVMPLVRVAAGRADRTQIGHLLRLAPIH